MLILSGSAKILNPSGLIETLVNLKILTDEIIIIISSILPVIEIILGIILIMQFNVKASALIVSFFYFSFFITAIYGYSIGLENDCGCFGGLTESKFGITMIIRNGALLLISAVLVYMHFFSKTSLKPIEFKN